MCQREWIEVRLAAVTFSYDFELYDYQGDEESNYVLVRNCSFFFGGVKIVFSLRHGTVIIGGCKTYKSTELRCVRKPCYA